MPENRKLLVSPFPQIYKKMGIDIAFENIIFQKYYDNTEDT